jgi:hypothetical protein
MNLFIGANGLGKTTTTNLIIYGIVGFNSEISQDYFLNRGKVEVTDEKGRQIKASVILEFSVGEHYFKIERYIENDAIKCLTIDKDKFTEEEIDNIDEEYEGRLAQYTGIQNLDDIVFLLKKFLIREEEANYLIWDDRGGDQSKLIRLLINDSGFEDEYSELAKTLKEADSAMRGKQDIKAQFQKRIDELTGEKEKELKKRKSYDSRQTFEQDLSRLEVEIEILKKNQTKNLEDISYTLNNIKSIDGKLESISAEYESKGEKTQTLESQLFKFVYADDKILNAVHKLKHYGICIYCNKKPKKEVIQKIINALEIENSCPVCHSHLYNDNQHDINSDETIKELESSQHELDSYKSKIAELETRKTNSSKDLATLWNTQQQLDKELHSKSISAYDVKILLSNLSKNPEEQITIYDTQISALENQILKYEKEIAKDNKKATTAKNKLLEKNEEQNKIITAFEKELNKIFTSYTSKYFKSDCSLVTTTGKPKESNISVTSYVPSFDGKMRKAIKNCSTSERIFLEYLFRLSLLQLYCQKSKNQAFMIMETTEGAFDITNTEQLAGAFVEFGKKNIPFIIITNFSKPDFLKSISVGIKRQKNRFLNFLEIGNISGKQKQGIKKYNQVIKKLSLA